MDSVESQLSNAPKRSQVRGTVRTPEPPLRKQIQQASLTLLACTIRQMQHSLNHLQHATFKTYVFATYLISFRSFSFPHLRTSRHLAIVRIPFISFETQTFKLWKQDDH